MSAFANFNDEMNNCYVSVSEPTTYHNEVGDLTQPLGSCSDLSLDSCSTAVASAAVMEDPCLQTVCSMTVCSYNCKDDTSQLQDIRYHLQKIKCFKSFKCFGTFLRTFSKLTLNWLMDKSK